MIIRQLVVIIFLLGHTVKVYGEEVPWLVLGVGNQRCDAVLDFQDGRDEETRRIFDLALHAWASGFFSGMNLLQASDRIKDLSDNSIAPAALAARILGKCYEDPKAVLTEVLLDIYIKLPE